MINKCEIKFLSIDIYNANLWMSILILRNNFYYLGENVDIGN